MTLEAFLEAAWNDHADRPLEVADRLAVSLYLVQTPGHIPPYARLATHVFGEHLGQWNRGVALLESLRGLSAFDEGHAAAGAVVRGIATLRYAGGDTAVLKSLPVEDQVSVLAGAASAFAGRKTFAQALAAYTAALRLGDAELPSGSPAIRALAVGGNNLAAALEEKPDRDSAETRGMIAAAEAGLKYWKRAGTWLEEERAEYRLTRSLLQGGELGSAIQSALRCIRICERNKAPASERFFACAALALVQRSVGDSGPFEASRKRALQLLGQVPQEERQSCEVVRNELGK